MEDEVIELDEFEIFRNRAFSKRRQDSTKNVSRRGSKRLLQTKGRPISVGPPPLRGDHTGSSRALASGSQGDDRSITDIKEDADSGGSVQEDETLIKKPAHLHSKLKVDRISSSPIEFRHRQLSPSRLGRSYSCRPRGTRPHVRNDTSGSRPRINSLAEATEVIRHSSLTSQYAIARESGEFQIYRVRSFTLTAKGIVNRGDSFKVRSPMCRRPLLAGSNEDMASSRASVATSIGKYASSIAEDESEVQTAQNTSGELPLFRVVISGAHGVGKTALAQQFMTSEYLGNMDALPDDGGETKLCVQLDNVESMVEFIDVDSLDCDVEEPDAYILIYDVTDRSSFRHAEGRLRELRSCEEGRQQSIVILVANKEDLVRNRLVSAEDGVKIASKYSCKYIEVSAILNHKVDELLVGILRQIRLHPVRPACEGPGRSDGRCRNSDSAWGCLPKPIIELVSCIFGKKENLTKSCENLLVL